MSVFSTFGLGKSRPGGDAYSRVNVACDIVTKSQMGIGRPAAYGINGTGRDSYIAVDNGGFSKPFEPSYTPDTGVFGSRRL